MHEDAVRRAGWLATLGQDLRYAGRTLGAAPAFSIAVLLAVALSIGPVAAILSVGNWLLWRPHPGVSDARSLAVVWFGRWRQTATGVSVSPSGVSADGLAGIRSRARSVTGIAGVQESSAALAVAGAAPREAGAATVSADFFEVLGVRLSAGRSFTPEDDRGPAGSPVVVVSHGLAQSAFGSAPAAVGQTVDAQQPAVHDRRRRPAVLQRHLARRRHRRLADRRDLAVPEPFDQAAWRVLLRLRRQGRGRAVGRRRRGRADRAGEAVGRGSC